MAGVSRSKEAEPISGLPSGVLCINSAKMMILERNGLRMRPPGSEAGWSLPLGEGGGQPDGVRLRHCRDGVYEAPASHPAREVATYRGSYGLPLAGAYASDRPSVGAALSLAAAWRNTSSIRSAKSWLRDGNKWP